MKLRAPAVPLITVDPYFSVWSQEINLNYSTTVHWTGKPNSIYGTVSIDGSSYAFLGYHREAAKLRQVSLEITALSTLAVYETETVRLRAEFTTPLLLDDLRLLTRPVSYLSVTYESLDGKPHEVSCRVAVSEELCLDRAKQSPIVVETAEVCDCVKAIRMGNTEQKPLNRSGDDLRIDWGYCYLAVQGKNTTVQSSNAIRRLEGMEAIAELDEGERALYCFAYDDLVSIEYFGAHLKSYWNRNGQTIEQAICEAVGEYDAVKARCNAFSERLASDAQAAGGEEYAELLSLAYRQAIAAHKVVLDENGELLFISKECFSNGCAATVDVSYPSIPLFLLYNPELVKGMLRPIYRYAVSEEWAKTLKYDFAPHDVGQYPLLNGQVYGKNALRYQMPVEECGNMLVMEANVAMVTGSADFAANHLELLRTWCGYLEKYGSDPGDQLCTDDFAGHLEHNCNLSLKAIMGIRGMAILEKMLGNAEKAARCEALAASMAEQWMKTALNANGSSRLAFDQPNTYSMKYNMVWDLLWNTKLFSQEFRDRELRSNLTHANIYGLPLDSRADYTKSDWLVWTASMASDPAVFRALIAPLWKAYNESPSRVPMTDWYDTVSGRIVGFQNRTVQGGLYMKLLINKWLTVAKEFNV
ncbi:MAG: DUF4965 domain-containing protein [Ruminococcaceae bacterium]|nr:DUF4965 domain-containing protein [Oscillospiraceae bacterium]